MCACYKFIKFVVFLIKKCGYCLSHLDLFLVSLFSFMLQKLFSLIDQTSVPDNPDSLQNQEILLPGHLITIYLKVIP